MIMTHELAKLEAQMTDTITRLAELEKIVRSYSEGLPAATEEEIVTLIRENIKNMGVSQGFLSQVMGYSRPTISMILNGKRRMPLEVMLAFMEIIGWKLVAVPKSLPFTPDPEGDDEDGSQSDVH